MLLRLELVTKYESSNVMSNLKADARKGFFYDIFDFRAQKNSDFLFNGFRCNYTSVDNFISQ